MGDADFINKVTTINGKWDARIAPLQRQLLALEQILASRGTPAPGGLPPVLTPTQVTEYRVLDQRLQSLIQQFNQANRDWLAELSRIPTPEPVVGLKDKIPWPNWVGDSGKDYVMKCIDQGGIPITDRVTLKKAPGTWTGIEIEYDW